MSSSLLLAGVKDPLHQPVVELKAVMVGVAMAQERVVTKCVHRCAATHTYVIYMEHSHA